MQDFRIPLVCLITNLSSIIFILYVYNKASKISFHLKNKMNSPKSHNLGQKFNSTRKLSFIQSLSPNSNPFPSPRRNLNNRNIVNNPNLHILKSPLKQNLSPTLMRYDSSQSLQSYNKQNYFCENNKYEYKTEKSIHQKLADIQNNQNSTTMKEINNLILNKKSNFYPKQCKKPFRTSFVLKDKCIDGQSFDIIKQIGKGKYGSVFLVKEKELGFLLALKSIEKKRIRDPKLLEQFIRQLKIQSYLNHPGVVKLYGFFSDQENFYLLMELGCDGQLFDFYEQRKFFSQESTSFIARSMLEVVAYLHKQKVLHRDIKPQNIVVILGNVKICDFGWAVYNNNQLRSTFCGTPMYFSPQLLSRQVYDEKVDLWAIGVMIFQLIFGRSPFNLRQARDLSKIVTHNVQFPKSKHVSSQFKEFIGQILEKNPEKRPTSEQLLQTRFIKHYQTLQICQQLCKKTSKSSENQENQNFRQ